MTPHLADDTDALLDRAEAGDAAAVDDLFRRYRDRLRRMVAVHLDRRVTARIDPSDVVQDTLAEASGRVDEFLRQRPMLFYPWLRKLAWQRVIQLHRHHLHAERRSVRHEVRVQGVASEASRAGLVEHLAARAKTPSTIAQAEEERRRVSRAVEQLPPADRDVLVLKFLEQLSTREAAAVLGITPNAFAQRQLRAINRLRKLLVEGKEE